MFEMTKLVSAQANRRYFETRFSEPKTEQKKEKQG